MGQFQVGMSSLDVCKLIVEHHPEIQDVTLITHQVGINWRQQHQTIEAKLQNIVEGFTHSPPNAETIYGGKRFSEIDELSVLNDPYVWSMTSRVRCDDGVERHIPMMNFHPEGASQKDIVEAIKHISGGKKGVLLNSGRYLHSYGDFLLEEKDWQQFLADFLMPCTLVSPRYIGHCLHRGYCTLRLTADTKFKPQIPIVIETF